jgi:hypothetical protein
VRGGKGLVEEGERTQQQQQQQQQQAAASSSRWAVAVTDVSVFAAGRPSEELASKWLVSIVECSHRCPPLERAPS